MEQAGVRVMHERQATKTRITAQSLAATDRDRAGDQKVDVLDLIALGLYYALIIWAKQAGRNRSIYTVFAQFLHLLQTIRDCDWSPSALLR